MKKFYIYKVYQGEELVYVGKGKDDRWKHVTSGKSHNANINRLFYEHILLGKEPLEVSICYVESESEAFKEEHKLIFENKPVCNEYLVNNEPEDYVWGEECLKGDTDWKKGPII